jgi:hypothetical protein
MRSGRLVQDQIIEALRDSDFLILMVSRNSLVSAPVATEWKTKFAEKFSQNIDTVFPLYIDDTSPAEMPEYLRHIYGYRYRTDADTENLQRLVNDLLFWRERRPVENP